MKKRIDREPRHNAWVSASTDSNDPYVVRIARRVKEQTAPDQQGYEKRLDEELCEDIICRFVKKTVLAAEMADVRWNYRCIVENLRSSLPEGNSPTRQDAREWDEQYQQVMRRLKRARGQVVAARWIRESLAKYQKALRAAQKEAADLVFERWQKVRETSTSRTLAGRIRPYFENNNTRAFFLRELDSILRGWLLLTRCGRVDAREILNGSRPQAGSRQLFDRSIGSRFNEKMTGEVSIGAEQIVWCIADVEPFSSDLMRALAEEWLRDPVALHTFLEAIFKRWRKLDEPLRELLKRKKKKAKVPTWRLSLVTLQIAPFFRNGEGGHDLEGIQSHLQQIEVLPSVDLGAEHLQQQNLIAKIISREGGMLAKGERTL